MVFLHRSCFVSAVVFMIVVCGSHLCVVNCVGKLVNAGIGFLVSSWMPECSSSIFLLVYSRNTGGTEEG